MRNPVTKAITIAPSVLISDEIVTGLHDRACRTPLPPRVRNPSRPSAESWNCSDKITFPVFDSEEIYHTTSTPSPHHLQPRPSRIVEPRRSGKPPAPPKRENTLQKINGLDVKGRIQLALKGSKEERSILIRDGTKVVSFAVLEAPKLSDGEVEKFASQKNVLEAVLRQIPLKRRFMKNYIVVRNLVRQSADPARSRPGLDEEPA